MNIVNTIYSTASAIYSSSSRYINEYYYGTQETAIKPVSKPKNYILPRTQQESSKLKNYEDYKDYKRRNSGTSSDGSLSPSNSDHIGVAVYSYDYDYNYCNKV